MSLKKAKSAPSLKQGEELRTGIVQYMYIPRRIFGVTDKRHVLYDGKLDISVDTFFVLKNPSGKFMLDLNETEKAWIEEEMGLEPGTLNVNDRKNEYLGELQVELPKQGITLDLSDPYQMLVDGVLSAYDNIMAKGLQSKNAKRSYRYVRVSENEETDIILEVADNRKKAYKLLGSLEESREKMIMTLLYTGYRLHPEIPTKELRRKVNELVEESYEKFIAMMEDPYFNIKGLINMAVLTGVIEVKRGLHYYGTEPLAAKDEAPTFKNACEYLADKTNSNIKVAISKDTLDDFKRT